MSETNSLRPIPDSYWVTPGRLLAGEYPGDRQATEAVRKLQRLLDSGITAFVDLTEAGEYDLRPYAPLLADLPLPSTGRPAQHLRLPIPDMGTPSPARMEQILETLEGLLAAGEGIYLHCFGGIGRTGTVVGCYLVRRGLDGDAALAQIAAWRQGIPDGHRRSPETDAQRSLVRGWRAVRRGAGG